MIAKPILQNFFERVVVFQCGRFHKEIDSSKTPNAASKDDAFGVMANRTIKV